MLDATPARLIRPTPAYCELIFQLAHYQRSVGAAEAERVREEAVELRVHPAGGDVELRGGLVASVKLMFGAMNPCRIISIE